jgi:hypothetical protein
MSTFCGGTPGTVPSYTSGQWLEQYRDPKGGTGILPPVLPEITDGLADESWVQQYVKGLEDRSVIPRAPQRMETLPTNMFNSPDTKDPMATYIEKDNDFQDSVKAEYCFYEGRYFAALDAFLQAVGGSSLGNASQSNVQQRLATTKKLNAKLTLLIQIVNGTSIYKYSIAQRYQQGINSVNENLRSNETKLRRQKQILDKENTALDISRRMVEYTTEKNRANNNLLAIYGVLNIVALAMVFYVART